MNNHQQPQPKQPTLQFLQSNTSNPPLISWLNNKNFYSRRKKWYQKLLKLISRNKILEVIVSLIWKDSLFKKLRKVQNSTLLSTRSLNSRKKLGLGILVKCSRANGEEDKLLLRKLKMIWVRLGLKNNLKDK